MRPGVPDTPEQAADSFADALERFDAVRATEHDGILPACRSRLLHHGRPTERTYLLFHGFTNCPAQYETLADALFESGHTVFAPLAQGHGRRDGSPVELSELTADGIARWADEMVDIAAGLGRELHVVGFSFGGVCAAWVARHRDEVDDVTLLAPGFVPNGFPWRLRALLPAYLRLTRERYVWWDPVRRERAPLGPHSYRQLSRRGIGEVFELGNRTWGSRSPRQTRMKRARLVVNDFDLAINNSAARHAFADAIAPLAESSDVQRIKAEHRLPHDYLDPFRLSPENSLRNLELVLGFVDDGDPDRAR